MEKLSQQQQIELGRQTSFTSIIVKNVSIATKSSTGFDVREPFQSYAEVVDVNYPTNMVSTTSTPTPSTQTTSPFYLLRDDPPKPAETSSSLLVKHGLDQMYQKFCGKKVKESLSSFLPHLPGVIDEHGGPGNSLQSVVDKPPIGGKELLPLPSLSGFLLNAGPIPEQFRFMSQQPVKKKHRHKKHRSQESERGKDGGETLPSSRSLEMEKQTSNDKPEGGHEKKHKKQKKHEDGERKKKKKEKKKKKRHTPDPIAPGGGPDPS